MQAAAKTPQQLPATVLAPSSTDRARAATAVFTPTTKQQLAQHPNRDLVAATAVRMQSCSTTTNHSTVQPEVVDVHAELEAAIDAVRAASMLCKVGLRCLAHHEPDTLLTLALEHCTAGPAAALPIRASQQR